MGIIKTLTLSILFCTYLSAQTLSFSIGEKLRYGNNYVNNPFGTPTVADWDNDGVKDLLVGEMVRAGPYNYLTGKLAFYKNGGSNSNPNLSEPEYVKVNGSDIELSAG